MNSLSKKKFFRSFSFVDPSSPIHSKQRKQIVKADAITNCAHLLIGIQRNILNIEKVLCQHGRVLNNLAADFVKIKDMFEDCTADNQNTAEMTFSPATTKQELTALTDDFKVSITKINGFLSLPVRLFPLYGPIGRAATRSLWSGRSEVQISGRSSQAQCCQQLATAVTFLRKELCSQGAIMRK